MFVNMLYPLVAKYINTSGVETHSDGVAAGCAQSGEINYEYVETPLYGDGARVDGGKELVGGTVKIGTTRLTAAARALIGGHTYAAATTGENATPAKITVKKGDKPVEVSFGFVSVQDDESKVAHYFANFYPRLIFATPNASYKTAEKAKAFQTPTIEGEMLASVSGEIECITEHASIDACLTYLKTLLSIA